MDFEPPIGDVNLLIRVDADQVGGERPCGGLFGQRQAMRDHRLFDALVCIDENAGDG